MEKIDNAKEPSALDNYKDWYSTDIEKFKKYVGYIKLQNNLIYTDLSQNQKEIVLLQYGAAFIKELDKLHKDELIMFVTEQYPEIISCVDVVKEGKPLFKFIWSFYKKDEVLIDQIFDKQGFQYKKYNIDYEKCEYLLYVINSFVNCRFDDDVFHTAEGRKVQLEGYKPFDKFGRKMIPHGMRWYIYSDPKKDIRNLFRCFPVRILELQQTGEDVSWSKEGYRKDLDMGFRSTWEANIARLLNYLNIEWKYESKFIPLDLSKERVSITPNYLPDFQLNDGTIIEVKGFWDTRSKAKMKLVSEQYPDQKILIIDADFYRCIQNKYKDSIAYWEEDTITPFSDVMQVVGVTIAERKPYVTKVMIGDELVLERDLCNKFDKNAIMVKNLDGNVIGFIAREYANILASKMDAGFKYKATVKEKLPKIIQCDVKLQNTEDIILPELFI